MLETRDATRPQDPPGEGLPRHVLIAVDDSPGARRTLLSGLAEAAAHGADVTVVHVMPPRHWRVGRFGPVRAVPMRVRDAQASPILRDARRLAFDRGLCPRVELIASDDVDGTILGLAARLRSGAIVVGARRPDAVAAPLGVCARVLRRAPVPVVVVPPERARVATAPASDAGGRAGAPDRRPRPRADAPPGPRAASRRPPGAA